MSTLGGDSFDQWLGQQLQQHAAAHAGPSPLPVQAQYHAAYAHGALQMSLLAKAGTILTTKAAIGVTVSVLALAGVGEAAITGSINPKDWGQQVVQQVQKCKAALAPGSHGIGECVSSFASQHGKTQSAQHKATPTPNHGAGHSPRPTPDKVHPTPPVHPTPSKNSHK
jgi:hypothetical protein